MMKKLKKIVPAIAAAATVAVTSVVSNYKLAWADMTAIATADDVELSFMENEYGMSIVGCSRNAVRVEIPTELNGKPVTEVADNAFFACNELISVVIPDTVTSIGPSAFFDCRELESVTIPSSVTTIGSFAFSGCHNLKEVIIPEGVTTIDLCAFADCKKLEYVSVPESIQTIGYNAFVDTPWLKKTLNKNNPFLILHNKIYAFYDHVTKANVPYGVTRIDDEAFQDSGVLTRVTLPDSLETIGSFAFSNCINLLKINIPNSVVRIEPYAFNVCDGLTTMKFSKNMEKIEYGLFAFASGLTYIQVPKNITEIEEKAFGSCTILDYITIENPDCIIFDDPSTISNDFNEFDEYEFNGIIYGHKDSTAQEYAEKYGYSFGVIGDVNEDGEFSAADLVIAERFLMGKGPVHDWKAGDRNCDHVFDTFDLIALRKELVNKLVRS